MNAEWESIRAEIEEAARPTDWRVVSVERRQDGQKEYLGVLLRRRDGHSTGLNGSLTQVCTWVRELPKTPSGNHANG